MLKLLAVECPDGTDPLDVRVGVPGGGSIVVGIGAQGCIGAEDYAAREATPDDIREAFVAQAKASGAADDARGLFAYSWLVDDRKECVRRVMRALGLSAILEPPAPASAEVKDSTAEPGNQPSEPSAPS